MDTVAIAVAKTIKPALVTCGASDCKGDHRTFLPKDCVLLSTQLQVDADSVDNEGKTVAVENGLIQIWNGRIFPTVLGEWWTDAVDSVN